MSASLLGQMKQYVIFLSVCPIMFTSKRFYQIAFIQICLTFCDIFR